jgi:hypothetical protein
MAVVGSTAGADRIRTLVSAITCAMAAQHHHSRSPAITDNRLRQHVAPALHI